MNNFSSTAGSSLISRHRVAAEGRALVRCLAADEDPEGTVHVSHMIQASHRQLEIDQSKDLQCSISGSKELSINPFYEAVSPNCVSKVVCQSPLPLWEPHARVHSIRVYRRCRGTCILESHSTHTAHIAGHLQLQSNLTKTHIFDWLCRNLKLG